LGERWPWPAGSCASEPSTAARSSLLAVGRRSGVQGRNLGATAMGIGGLGSRGGREVVGRGELSGARLGGGSVHGERRRHTGRRRACELVISFGTALVNRHGRGRGHSRADDVAWSAALHARRLARAHPRTTRGPGPVQPWPRCGARGKARRGPHGSPRSTTKLPRLPYAGRMRGRHVADAAAACARRAGRGDGVGCSPFIPLKRLRKSKTRKSDN
jgi:hypothetical protein